MKNEEQDEAITQELPALAQEEASEPEKQFEIAFGACTDLGRIRENNEDKFDFLEPEDARILRRRGRLYAVADGMGGHAAGQIAAEMALKALFDTYYASRARSPQRALQEGFRRANELVFRTATTVPSRQGMGTTLTAAAVVGDRLIVANLGDSRAYLLREGKARQVTEDHSLVEEQVRQGMLSEEQAVASPFKNIITKCIGNGAEVEPDLFEEVLQIGDKVLLCSDGLSNQVSGEEMAAVAEKEAPSVAARQLIKLANERGGPDNITAVVLGVGGAKPAAKANTVLLLPWVFLVGFASALAVATLIMLAVG